MARTSSVRPSWLPTPGVRAVVSGVTFSPQSRADEIILIHQHLLRVGDQWSLVVKAVSTFSLRGILVEQRRCKIILVEDNPRTSSLQSWR